MVTYCYRPKHVFFTNKEPNESEKTTNGLNIFVKLALLLLGIREIVSKNYFLSPKNKLFGANT